MTKFEVASYQYRQNNKSGSAWSYLRPFWGNFPNLVTKWPQCPALHRWTDFPWDVRSIYWFLPGPLFYIFLFIGFLTPTIVLHSNFQDKRKGNWSVQEREDKINGKYGSWIGQCSQNLNTLELAQGAIFGSVVFAVMSLSFRLFVFAILYFCICHYVLCRFVFSLIGGC